MVQPAWKTPPEESEEPEDDENGVTLLQRWVERPGGRLELVEIPLTPELFLDPQLEDKMVQGEFHASLMAELKELLSRYFHSQPDVKVLMDVKHLLGRGLPGPAPDISIIRGVRHPERERRSFNVVKEGVAPCFILEIVSYFDARIRRTDEVDKVKLYERIEVEEYFLVDMPRKGTGGQFQLKGYRLSSDRRYRLIEPDDHGRLLSGETGLLFGVSPNGGRVEVFDAASGERIRTPLEEVEARKAAEAELARLRAEIERLKGTRG
ncbi:MAG: Uma2 family endonuclease [Thermoanaerobaculia bacterium]